MKNKFYVGKQGTLNSRLATRRLRTVTARLVTL